MLMVAVPDSRAVRRPANIPFDGTHIFDSDQLLWGGITHIPRRVVFGGRLLLMRLMRS